MDELISKGVERAPRAFVAIIKVFQTEDPTIDDSPVDQARFYGPPFHGIAVARSHAHRGGAA